MKLFTASSVIRFATQLEDDSARLYELLRERYPEHRDLFSSFITENAKHKVAIERAYYGVISDALEGCFSFQNLDTEEFVVYGGLPEHDTLAHAVEFIMSAEKRIVDFYVRAAESSKSLMADVPRVFHRIARKKADRITQLMSLTMDQG